MEKTTLKTLVEEMQEKVANFESKMEHYNKLIPDLNTQSMASNDNVKRYGELLNVFENRCTMLEKKMQFYNIKEPLMNYDWSETQTRGLIEDIFTPTQQRMSEIQEKFGHLCQMQVDQGKAHEKMYKEMQEAMGLGKGTLKQQIERDVFKQIKSINNTVEHHLRESETLSNTHEMKLKNFEAKIQIWTDIQENNRKTILKVEKNIEDVKNYILQELDQRIEKVHQTQSHTISLFHTLNSDFKLQDIAVTNKLKILDEFGSNLRQNLLMVQTNEHRVLKNERSMNEFKNDDIFINAWNNYVNVYQEQMDIRNNIEVCLQPSIDQCNQNITKLTSLRQHNQLKALTEDIQFTQQQLQRNIQSLQSSMEQKIEDLKKDLAAGTKKKFGSQSSGSVMKKSFDRRRGAPSSPSKPKQSSQDVIIEEEVKIKTFQIEEQVIVEIDTKVEPPKPEQPVVEEVPQPLPEPIQEEVKVEESPPKISNEINKQVDVKKSLSNYNSFMKNKTDIDEKIALLREEIFEKLAADYLHLDNCGEYINDIVVENLQEFEEQQDSKLEEEIEEMKQFFEQKKEEMTKYVDENVAQINKQVRDRMTTQDDQIDIIACELSKDTKKKSDFDIQIAKLIREQEFTSKRLFIRFENEMQTLKDTLKTDLHDAMCKVDHQIGQIHELQESIENIEIKNEDIKAKPILKPHGGRRLKSAVAKVKIQGKLTTERKSKIDVNYNKINNKNQSPVTIFNDEGTNSSKSQIDMATKILINTFNPLIQNTDIEIKSDDIKENQLQKKISLLRNMRETPQKSNNIFRKSVVTAQSRQLDIEFEKLEDSFAFIKTPPSQSKLHDMRQSFQFSGNNRLLSPQLNTISGSGLLFEDKQSRDTLATQTTNTKASKAALRGSQDLKKLRTRISFIQ